MRTQAKELHSIDLLGLVAANETRKALSLFLTLFYLPSLPLSAKRRSFWHWPDKFLTLNIEVRESLGSKFALKF
ncbi:hypothetical protein LWI28_007014 [Acer negundo]|uniref:Uncharacterized protein n=1 Tax=Acer negundo TaxID=4023 RepID=A0AAD5NDJ3_ACENE|nr:hypothetical protein LWI28_007014 [Acer negundo]